MKIVVIDDEPAIRDLIETMLSSEGFSVLKASNGSEGLGLIMGDDDIQLVITDLIMPDKEGIETIIELKKNRPNIKIIAISGGGRGGIGSYLETAKSLGADMTLSKPFMKKDLLDTIARVTA